MHFVQIPKLFCRSCIGNVYFHLTKKKNVKVMGSSRLHHFTKAHVMHYMCNFLCNSFIAVAQNEV